jgi:hypothetical protein
MYSVYPSATSARLFVNPADVRAAVCRVRRSISTAVDPDIRHAHSGLPHESCGSGQLDEDCELKSLYRHRRPQGYTLTLKLQTDGRLQMAEFLAIQSEI